MTTLDITALRSLIAVASLAGVRRAADALHLSQPAVSGHLRKLEDELGFEIVFRQGRSIAFTARGEDLLREAYALVAAHDAALARLGGGYDHDIVVASTEHASAPMLQAVARLLREEFPHRGIRFEFHRSARLREFVHKRTATVAIGFGDLGRGVEHVADVPLEWIGSDRAPVAAHRLVAFARPCVIRDRMLALGEDFSIERECVDMASLVNAVRSGVGVTALPSRTRLAPGLHPLQGLPALGTVPMTVVVGAEVTDRVRQGIHQELREVWAAL
ncbi:LysR family transcriptional regulator [Microbacterium terrisoli]|uniref:LysR family transcriptional regulator n=1 Tax=Microbacterium terrisoli TaxID=3242192 RepID=UPI0028037A0E|nr:LysR family transcriptional regulator [Microbacterium protaetiae]